jgi:ribonuclease R
MADKVGDELTATSPGVSAFGLYIELVEHFVEWHGPRLDDGRRLLPPSSSGRILRGENNGRVFRLGDRVKVQVIKVDLERRQIDLSVSPRFSKRCASRTAAGATGQTAGQTAGRRAEGKGKGEERKAARSEGKTGGPAEARRGRCSTTGTAPGDRAGAAADSPLMKSIAVWTAGPSITGRARSCRR